MAQIRLPSASATKKYMANVQRQYWELKSTYFDDTLFKVGRFYELYYLDADIGHKICELSSYMAGKSAEFFVHHGCKVYTVEQTDTKRTQAYDEEKSASNSSKCKPAVLQEVWRDALVIGAMCSTKKHMIDKAVMFDACWYTNKIKNLLQAVKCFEEADVACASARPCTFVLVFALKITIVLGVRVGYEQLTFNYEIVHCFRPIKYRDDKRIQREMEKKNVQGCKSVFEN